MEERNHVMDRCFCYNHVQKDAVGVVFSIINSDKARAEHHVGKDTKGYRSQRDYKVIKVKHHISLLVL